MLNVWQTSTNNDENENPLEKNDQIVKMDIIKKNTISKKILPKNIKFTSHQGNESKYNMRSIFHLCCWQKLIV